MGKAAQRRRARRRRYLAGLALTDQERFLWEWNRRVRSWLYETWRRAGHLSPEAMPATFDVVKEAKQILAECEGLEVSKEARCAIQELEAECARAVAAHTDNRLYEVSVRYERT